MSSSLNIAGSTIQAAYAASQMAKQQKKMNETKGIEGAADGTSPNPAAAAAAAAESKDGSSASTESKSDQKGDGKAGGDNKAPTAEEEQAELAKSMVRKSEEGESESVSEC